MTTEPDKAAGDPWARPGAQQAGAMTVIDRQKPGTDGLNQARATQAVSVTAIDIPFWSLVRFGLKLAVAALPAMLVLLLVVTALLSLAGALLGTAMLAALTELLNAVAESVSWPW